MNNATSAACPSLVWNNDTMAEMAHPLMSSPQLHLVNAVTHILNFKIKLLADADDDSDHHSKLGGSFLSGMDQFLSALSEDVVLFLLSGIVVVMLMSIFVLIKADKIIPTSDWMIQNNKKLYPRARFSLVTKATQKRSSPQSCGRTRPSCSQLHRMGLPTIYEGDNEDGVEE